MLKDLARIPKTGTTADHRTWRNMAKNRTLLEPSSVAGCAVHAIVV
jgi:hypothetical protein